VSDEKDIQDVMHDEFRAARGKPPLHTAHAERIARVRAAMLVAINEGNEADFINCVLDLGHIPDSDEYNRMMTLWNQRPRACGWR
jgi:hypothetical protein